MTLWGLGPPLAIAAWLGFFVAAIQLLRNPRRHYLQVLPLVWVGVNFAYWGVQFAKPMRYLLPIYPQLALFAAVLLVATWGWVRQSDWLAWAPWRPSPRLRRAGAAALAVVVVGWSALYAIGFAGSPPRPPTRI